MVMVSRLCQQVEYRPVPKLTLATPTPYRGVSTNAVRRFDPFQVLHLIATNRKMRNRRK